MQSEIYPFSIQTLETSQTGKEQQNPTPNHVSETTQDMPSTGIVRLNRHGHQLRVLFPTIRQGRPKVEELKQSRIYYYL